MNAENAWRIAMEFAVVAGNPRPTADFEAAFRAEVEAETEELREALGRIRDETLMGVSHGLGDRIYSIASGALSRLEAKGEPK